MPKLILRKKQYFLFRKWRMLILANLRNADKKKSQNDFESTTYR